MWSIVSQMREQCAVKNMVSWFMKQPTGGERVSDIAAISSTEESHSSPAVKNER
jgi:hypothetical protein